MTRESSSSTRCLHRLPRQAAAVVRVASSGALRYDSNMLHRSLRVFSFMRCPAPLIQLRRAWSIVSLNKCITGFYDSVEKRRGHSASDGRDGNNLDVLTEKKEELYPLSSNCRKFGRRQFKTLNNCKVYFTL